MVKSGMACQGGFLFDDGVLEGQVLRASANATDRPNAGTDQQREKAMLLGMASKV